MTAADFDYAPLRRIGWPWAGAAEDPRWRALAAAHPGARPARVSEQHRTGYVLADAPDTGFRVESPPEWQRRPVFTADGVPLHERAAVGDWVLHDGRRILALLPRRSAIKRAAAGEHYQQQVIAANVDTAFVVCGLDADFNPRRIERYLLLIGGGGSGPTAAPQPVIVLTKADRDGADAEAALAALAGLRAQGVPVLSLNARDPEAVAALAPWLAAGCTAVLVGSSGAGKSTLTNSLLGELRMKTAQVREHDSRGRHTTTHRALIALPSGACLIDTPGMRELKPTGEEELADGGFGDIEALAAQCRFNDCAHHNEPGCAVRAGIAAGEVEAARVGHYLKLRDEVAGAAGRLAARLAQKSQARPPGRPPHRSGRR
ncbi:ribosome small subunit-dependent GTPase A [Pseudoxanthomonas broegbernensis]|uniref:Small ribosomal subunit biogenesis GTPase RsgA n=1 Tax=Pseudoxanthomonas broegbernensis TaxID=83619 RepID=A0A7V8GK98_9GAMM|nr:ribosome small subunit-dependent GTPase A [Pseudoxanthomonas broegbernensis]KAF1684928.1 ribosome small subunit-dependent GTPase A [Pseudoxanthomonas broegbernensis]MBB6066298.1 ribosome biogenesis GTPase [Pseudoxanthomonas broegbernensis]